ncbi:hypothetical protein DY000_02032970 [Brassica cretica]|uniref:Uncharacterized protein n=1 Tax=Brassica cretica TaxID=69181 RepID=A0ABQ7DLK5_BRACR|nr:hypothetical protein DY000_02032970 [Brassica cretica]
MVYRAIQAYYSCTAGIVPPVPLFNSKTNFTSVLEGSGWRGVRVPPLVAQSTSGTSQCCDFVHGSVAWLCFAGLERSVSFSSDHSIPVSCFSVLDQRSSAYPSSFTDDSYAQIGRENYGFRGVHRDIATPETARIFPASEEMRRTSHIYGYCRRLRTVSGS